MITTITDLEGAGRALVAMAGPGANAGVTVAVP
jgi:hypothetical protein